MFLCPVATVIAVITVVAAAAATGMDWIGTSGRDGGGTVLQESANFSKDFLDVH